MKCFIHVDQDAVASCQKCGKGLCKECASKHTPCMCEECFSMIENEKNLQEQAAEEERKEKYKKSLVDTRSEFITSVIFGVLWAIFLNYCLIELNFFKSLFYGISLVFGWKLLTYWQGNLFDGVFATAKWWLFVVAFKVVFAIFIGMPAFIYQFIKVFISQNKIKTIEVPVNSEEKIKENPINK